MKLAEALQLRTEQQNKLASLRERIKQNVLVQESEEPSEDPNQLLKQWEAVAKELTREVVRINRTNLNATTPRNRSLTEALAERDTLAALHKTLLETVRAAQERTDRYGSREIRWVRTVDVPELQRSLDETARDLREVNSEIQLTNWTVEVE